MAKWMPTKEKGCFVRKKLLVKTGLRIKFGALGLDHGKQLVNYAKFVSILILAGDAYYY